jgi:enamine deaminase RidA (YjgF/YER057c/UK114 family)
MKDIVKYYPEYWAGKKLAYPHVPPEHPKFSRSVVVGNLVFISGCKVRTMKLWKSLPLSRSR